MPAIAEIDIGARIICQAERFGDNGADAEMWIAKLESFVAGRDRDCRAKHRDGGRRPRKGPSRRYIADKFKAPRMNAVEDFQALHLANRGYESRLRSKLLHDEEVLANARDFLMKVPCLGGFDALIAKMAIVLPPSSLDSRRPNTARTRSRRQTWPSMRRSTVSDPRWEARMRNWSPQPVGSPAV